MVQEKTITATDRIASSWDLTAAQKAADCEDAFNAARRRCDASCQLIGLLRGSTLLAVCWSKEAPDRPSAEASETACQQNHEWLKQAIIELAVVNRDNSLEPGVLS